MPQAADCSKRRGVFVGEVISNDGLCREHYRLCLRFKSFAPTQPGQFIQLQCRPLDDQLSMRPVDWPEGRPPQFTQGELTGREPLLRRPLSLTDRRDIEGGGVELDIIYRAIGTGTTWLAGVEAGASLSVLGPLGNTFRICEEKSLAAVVGGGVGIPPMIYLSQTLAAAGKTTVAFNGIRTGELLPLTLLGDADISSAAVPTRCVKEFADHDTNAVIASDDGSIGYAGMVNQAFVDWLDGCVKDPGDLAVYCCGPEPLMAAVGDVCISRNITCQVALERHMACGMGTCQSCVVKIRDDSQQGWSFKLCCTDGPIFDASDVIWNHH